MPKRPRLPKNLDDDELVERYNNQVDKIAADEAANAECHRTRDLGASDLEEEVIRKVETVIGNIIAVS
jgi:hypothetical protein